MPAEPARRLPARRFLIPISAALCLCMWLVHAVQPEMLAWLMLFPRWAWMLPGVGLVGMGFLRSQWKRAVAVFVFWGLFAAFIVEETRSVLRASLRLDPPLVAAESFGVRVVTLNCGSSQKNAAAEEAFALNPDLILFQESPPREAVEQLAARHWGAAASVAWGPDATIVARGRLTPRDRSKTGTWVWATWHHPLGDIEVVSLRLSRVPLRFDCWRADCWRSMTRLRDLHRSEIADLLKTIGPFAADRTYLIGGDFNAVAHDAALEALTTGCRDAFDEAGMGWGNTIYDGLAVHRIDQVWISQRLKATQVKAVHSRRSDHKLVVCSLKRGG